VLDINHGYDFLSLLINPWLLYHFSPNGASPESRFKFLDTTSPATSQPIPVLLTLCKLVSMSLYERDDENSTTGSVVDMKKPSKRVLCTFRDYVNGGALHIPGIGKAPMISGRAETFLEEDIDLIALQKPKDDDLLSTVLQDHWISQKRTATDPFDRTTIHSGRYVMRTVAAISMIIAALLLIGATVALHLIKNDKARLGMIAGFTFLFALSMLLLTNSRKAEIYRATAAYAAALVVLVSGDLSSDRNNPAFSELAAGGVLNTASCLC